MNAHLPVSDVTLGPYLVHPILQRLVPEMDDTPFEALKHSVLRDGLGEPITLTHDESTIVDGRARYRACEDVQRDPIFEILPERYDHEMILQYIVQKNLRRAHYTDDQLTVIQARIADAFATFATLP